MEVELEYSVERILKLLVHECVDERVDNAVRVAKKIAKIEEMMICASGRISTKALNQSADMIWGPAQHKGPV